MSIIMGNLNEQIQSNTIKCPHCKEDIQFGAKKCKHCGSDLRNWFVKNKIITTILILIGIGVIGNIIGFNQTKNNYNNSSTFNNTQENQSITDVKNETENESKVSTIPAEYESALNKANSYANTMYMSKKGVYNQLVSEYGEKFSSNAAKYAIDNIKVDWNLNALAKAKNYQQTMSMSPSKIHDQLTSEYGEKFTKSEADYAIKHLND